MPKIKYKGVEINVVHGHAEKVKAGLIGVIPQDHKKALEEDAMREAYEQEDKEHSRAHHALTGE